MQGYKINLNSENLKENENLNLEDIYTNKEQINNQDQGWYRKIINYFY
jgi:hypothetical protein